MYKVLSVSIIAVSLTGCGGYRTVYKPVSFKTPDMSYYGASEYCENVSERAYDAAIAQSKRNSEADYQSKKRQREEEAKTYTTTTNCSNPYSYGSGHTWELNCTQTHAPSNAGVPVFLRMADESGRGTVGLTGYMGASSAQRRAFKNCMFDKGYKQVRVKKGERQDYTTSSTKPIKKSTISSSDSRLKKAVQYLFGRGGVDMNHHKAFALLKNSAEKDNNPGGYFWLAYMYTKGKGVEKDASKAIELLAESIRLGSYLGRLSVLNDYVDGVDSGIELNRATAKKWLAEIVRKRDSSDKDMEGTFLRTKKSSGRVDELIESLK